MHHPIARFCRRSPLAGALAAAGALLVLGATAAPAWAAPAAAAEAVPPAAPRHANAEHPAVQVARLARRAEGLGIDANTFIVQPPAGVRWTLGPQADTTLRLATNTPADVGAASR